MKITAYMLAFGEDVPIPERIIEIPEHKLKQAVGRMVKDKSLDSMEKIEAAGLEAKLGLAFQYGQNDFQPQRIRSLSVGDVVKLPDGTLHRVLGAGWEHLSADTDVNTLERGIACSIL